MPGYRRTAPRGTPPAAAVRPSPDRRAPRERPGAAGAHRGTRERVHDLRSDASRSDTQVNASEVAHHDPTHADHNALETHVARFPIRSSRSAPPQLPRLRLSSPPLYLRSSDRFPGSFFMVLMLLSVPSCLPPPRLRPSTLHAWAALPGVCLQVEEGGSSAKRWTPLPRKPRRRAKPGPEAGRRPVDLQASTPRDQHPGGRLAHPGGACACPVCWVCSEGPARAARAGRCCCGSARRARRLIFLDTNVCSSRVAVHGSCSLHIGSS